MTNKKRIGAYYTPDFLSDFIFSRLNDSLILFDKLSILEPSVGNGSFLAALSRTNLIKKNTYIKALDINKKEINKLNKTKLIDISIDYLHKDFLRFMPSTEEVYNLIIGNPPYIKKSLLSASQIIFGNRVHKKIGLSKKIFKNIWSVFLLKSITLLDKNGILAFILPSELLQVKYADKLRHFLLDVFEKVEIYTFSDLLFECKGQDTIILIGYRSHEEKGVYYTHISDIKQIENNRISLAKNEIIQSFDIKWTHHILSSDDLQLLNNIKNRLNRVKDCCISKPGIVTAANDYFIINSDTEKKYNWTNYTKPIIQKGTHVKSGIVFNYSDFDELSESGKPIKIICLNDRSIGELNEKNKEYLVIGEKMEIPARYKCQLRRHWYIIPNISVPPEGFFFKRSYLFPRLLKNEANVLVTDSAYKIEMLDDFDINNFVFSFYNSLTFVFSELEGRYYGGGVLELTPNEFKKLPIPYMNITDAKFNELSKKFKENNDINEILNYTDYIILASIGLNKEKILRIQSLRNLLIRKRRRMQIIY